MKRSRFVHRVQFAIIIFFFIGEISNLLLYPIISNRNSCKRSSKKKRLVHVHFLVRVNNIVAIVDDTGIPIGEIQYTLQLSSFHYKAFMANQSSVHHVNQRNNLSIDRNYDAKCHFRCLISLCSLSRCDCAAIKVVPYKI